MSKRTKAYLIKNNRLTGCKDKSEAEKYYGKVKQCGFCDSWINFKNNACNYCHYTQP